MAWNVISRRMARGVFSIILSSCFGDILRGARFGDVPAGGF